MVFGTVSADVSNDIGAELLGDWILTSGKVVEGFFRVAIVTLGRYVRFEP